MTLNVKCHYAERHYAQCRYTISPGALYLTQKSFIKLCQTFLNSAERFLELIKAFFYFKKKFGGMSYKLFTAVKRLVNFLLL